MNSGFAGSASHDDRRRRRLLTEQNEDGAEGAAMVLSCSVFESSRNHRYPVKRILHYRQWRMWLIAGAMALLLASLLYGSWLNEQQDSEAWYSLLFDQSEGRLFSTLAAALLLLAGHLSGIIGWARSRSPNDFGGRYRVWNPIALMFYFASLSVVMRADEILNASLDYAAVTLPWDVAQWNWMIPTAGLAGIVLWIMHREMAISNLSRTHIWLGTACLASGLGLPFVPENQFQIASVPLVEQGLIVGGLMLIGLSLMWFGRHVLYVSSDPAERKPSLMLKMLKAVFRKRASKAKTPKVKKQKKSAAAASSTAEEDSPSQPKSSTSRRRGRRKPASGKTKSDQPEEKSEPSPAPAAAAEKPQLKVRAEDLSVDQIDKDLLQERLEMMELLAEEGEPLDQDLLKGLTKKQKKQLRSAWRDLERQYSQRKAG